MVTALDSEEEVQRAEAAMKGFCDQLAADEAWAKPLALSLEGLSHFRHQVLQAECEVQLLSGQLPARGGAQRATQTALLRGWLQATYNVLTNMQRLINAG